MDEEQGQPKYDLEERSFQFAHRVRQFVKRVPKSLSNYEVVICYLRFGILNLSLRR